jgi:hypothetical protein
MFCFPKLCQSKKNIKVPIDPLDCSLHHGKLEITINDKTYEKKNEKERKQKKIDRSNK